MHKTIEPLPFASADGGRCFVGVTGPVARRRPLEATSNTLYAGAIGATQLA